MTRMVRSEQPDLGAVMPEIGAGLPADDDGGAEPVSEAQQRALCARLAAGETLTRLCREPGLPSQAAVHAALARDPGFRARYARARALQAEHWAEEVLDIVDGRDGEGENHSLQRVRLRVEARKWMLGRRPAAGTAEGTDEAAWPELARLDERELQALRRILLRLAGQAPAPGPAAPIALAGRLARLPARTALTLA